MARVTVLLGNKPDHDHTGINRSHGNGLGHGHGHGHNDEPRTNGLQFFLLLRDWCGLGRHRRGVSKVG